MNIHFGIFKFKLGIFISYLSLLSISISFNSFSQPK
nr:MAG TPA: hypothetical protein [Caudoviricetes sp.]